MDFLGQPMSYWLELRRMIEENEDRSVPSLIKSNAVLRAKVSFYEEQIRNMESYRNEMSN